MLITKLMMQWHRSMLLESYLSVTRQSHDAEALSSSKIPNNLAVYFLPFMELLHANSQLTLSSMNDMCPSPSSNSIYSSEWSQIIPKCHPTLMKMHYQYISKHLSCSRIFVLSHSTLHKLFYPTQIILRYTYEELMGRYHLIIYQKSSVHNIKHTFART